MVSYQFAGDQTIFDRVKGMVTSGGSAFHMKQAPTLEFEHLGTSSRNRRRHLLRSQS